MDDVLTTGESAKLCGVSFRTVIRWVERGELNAYRLPGRGDFRVPRSELRRFMQAHGIPQPDAWLELPRRVLIAEDQAEMARAIERVLRGAGFETAVATNGFQAGSMLHTFRPGLLTLDIRMPWMDGLTVLQLLKRTPLGFPIKVLVISGESTTRLNEALALGAHGVLAKPFENADLLARVQGLFEAP